MVRWANDRMRLRFPRDERALLRRPGRAAKDAPVRLEAAQLARPTQKKKLDSAQKGCHDKEIVQRLPVL